MTPSASVVRATSDLPAPFVKWVGGKRKLADHIIDFMPSDVKRFVEPFVGGGAVFFALRGRGWDKPAVLRDVNPDLIAAWLCPIMPDLTRLVGQVACLPKK